MNPAPTLRLADHRDGQTPPAGDGLAELREHWPALADPVRAAVLTLVRMAVGVPAADTLPAMLDVADVARLLRMSRATVDRRDGEELIPAPVKLGRAKKWERDGFLAWLRLRKPDGTPFTRDEWARLSN